MQVKTILNQQAKETKTKTTQIVKFQTHVDLSVFVTI